MQKTNKKFLIIALCFALVTSTLIFSYLRSIQKPIEDTETIAVIIAEKTIEKKAVILASDLKSVKINKKYVHPKAMTNISDIAGKRADDKIIAGEQILQDRLVSKESSLLSYVIPDGKRAVTINVNEAIEVADFIRPGDFVDILATFDKSDLDMGKTKTIYPKTTVTLLQSIMVLGIGQQMDVPEKPKTTLPKTVTLAVNADEAEKLVYGQEAGVLRMSLRGTGDQNKLSPPGITREDVTPNDGKIIVPK